LRFPTPVKRIVNVAFFPYVAFFFFCRSVPMLPRTSFRLKMMRWIRQGPGNFCDCTVGLRSFRHGQTSRSSDLSLAHDPRLATLIGSFSPPDDCYRPTPSNSSIIHRLLQVVTKSALYLSASSPHCPGPLFSLAQRKYG